MFTSCQQIFFEEEIPADDPQVIFDYLWRECDEKYSFFEYKNIDWDAVYNEYSPRISEDMSADSLFNTLFAMLNELRDGHVNLVSPFNISRYETNLLGPDNFDFRLIKEHYIGEDYYITGPFTHDFIDNGTVGYIRYASFSGEISNYDLDYILGRYSNTRGLIFDIRENGGGSASNIYKILNRFTDSEVLLYSSYLKNGPGRDDFDEGEEIIAEIEGNRSYLGNIAVLTDRGTYSAGSFFTLGARSMPNMFIVGDTTGGGLGLPNGGQLPNGWTYRFSVSKTISPDGENFEDGVPPDHYILLDQVGISNGIDSVIERALEAL